MIVLEMYTSVAHTQLLISASSRITLFEYKKPNAIRISLTQHLISCNEVIPSTLSHKMT